MWANLFYSRLKSCAVFVYNDYCFTLQTTISEVTGVTEELQHQWNDTEDQWINSQLNRICAAGTYISRSFLHFTHCCKWCTAQYLEFRDVPVCLLSHSSCLTWDKIIRVWQWKRSKKKKPNSRHSGVYTLWKNCGHLKPFKDFKTSWLSRRTEHRMECVTSLNTDPLTTTQKRFTLKSNKQHSFTVYHTVTWNVARHEWCRSRWWETAGFLLCAGLL